MGVLVLGFMQGRETLWAGWRAGRNNKRKWESQILLMRSAHVSLPGVHNHSAVDPSLSLNALALTPSLHIRVKHWDLGWPQPDRRPDRGHRNEPVPVWNPCWWRQPAIILNQESTSEVSSSLTGLPHHNSLLNTCRESMWAPQSCGTASQWGRENRGRMH